MVWGVLGVGVTVVVQNVGVGLTSVSHASMMVGSMPVLVAVIAAVWHRHRLPAQAWAGLAISLVGVAVVAGGGGGQSSMIGDALVLFSLAISAAMTVAQVDMLRGRDPMAVTAVQFMAAAAGALPIALLTEGAPAAPSSAGPMLGVLGLTVVGTMLPWVFFAFGQARVPAAVAGSFLNIEPLVGAVLGAAFFGDAVGLAQIGAGLAILAGVALSTLAAVAPARETAPSTQPNPTPGPTPDPTPELARSGSAAYVAGRARTRAGRSTTSRPTPSSSSAGAPRPDGHGRDPHVLSRARTSPGRERADEGHDLGRQPPRLLHADHVRDVVPDDRPGPRRVRGQMPGGRSDLGEVERAGDREHRAGELGETLGSRRVQPDLPADDPVGRG